MTHSFPTRRASHLLKACSRRPQTAIEQDDRKRDAARHVSGLEIVELDAAWPVLAGEHPETEEHEQQRSADAGGNQPREDAQDDESCAEEDKLVADFHMVFSTAETGVGTLSAITTAAVVQHRGATERSGWPCCLTNEFNNRKRGGWGEGG